MYYRYKSKKKDRKLLKILFFFIIAGSLTYAGYNYRSKIMFWRVSHNRFVDQINQVSAITDSAKKIEKLRQLAEDIETYKQDNSLEPDSYIYSSRIYYNLGLALSGKSFTEMYLEDLFLQISSEQKKFFTSSIKDMSKALALLDGKETELQDLFVLGKSCFFTGYKDNAAIYSLLKNTSSGIDLLSGEDIRFYSHLCLSGGSFDEGLELLDKKGGVEDSLQGKLFKAKALQNSSKYTDAIIAFQKILKSSDDPYVQKISYSSLGRIYFSQSLYKESLEQFNAALNLGDDVNIKIWIGKNYLALGMKDKAKASWSEVLAANGENEEAKKLLGAL
jgi:tetratricopeptide (TPR) repeat protein